MPAPNVRPIVFRRLQGLNLLADARTSAPGSFVRLENVYRDTPSSLATRPGSRLFVRGDSTTIQLPPVTLPDAADLSDTLGETLHDVILDTNADLINEALTNIMRGPRGFVPRVFHRPVPSPGISTAAGNTALPSVIGNVVKLTPLRVSMLQRLYTNYDSNRWLVGAWVFEGGYGDRLFFVDESGATPVARVMGGTEQATGVGCTWHLQPYFVADEDNGNNRYFAVGTNGVGKPFALKVVENKPVFCPLNIVRSEQANPAGVGAGAQRLMAVRSLCVYNGSMVFGGYALINEQTTGDRKFEDFANYICFSDPGEPQSLASTNNVISSIRVGDSKFEPVTAVAVNSVETDTQGVQGQLVVFTSKKVVVYAGLPPVSGNPTGVSFQSIVLSTVGCNAPHSVVQTPEGLCFFGTDGLVYLIPRFSSGGPVPVSRAIEPLLKHLTPLQQRRVVAVYDDGRYKLSYPETNVYRGEYTDPAPGLHVVTPKGNLGSMTPNRQVWLDLRQGPRGGELDLGLHWDGPHSGMKHSAFAVAHGYTDHNVLFAGSAVDGSVFQASIEDYGQDPNPDAVTTMVPIAVNIEFGQIDGEDVHVEKTIRNLSYGVGTNRDVKVTASIFISGDVLNVEGGESFERLVETLGATMGDGLTMGGGAVMGNGRETYRPFTEFPSSPQRGTTFRFGFKAEPEIATQLRFSDFRFEVEMHVRPDRVGS